jgi:hypothetical protein
MQALSACFPTVGKGSEGGTSGYDFVPAANPEVTGNYSRFAIIGDDQTVAFLAEKNGGLIMDGQEHLGLFC